MLLRRCAIVLFCSPNRRSKATWRTGGDCWVCAVCQLGRQQRRHSRHSSSDHRREAILVFRLVSALSKVCTVGLSPKGRDLTCVVDFVGDVLNIKKSRSNKRPKQERAERVLFAVFLFLSRYLCWNLSANCEYIKQVSPDRHR